MLTRKHCGNFLFLFSRKRLIMIVSRASGAPLIAGAIRYAAELVRNHVFTIAKNEFSQANQAGLQKILTDHQQSGRPAETETVKAPPKEVVTAQILGIEIMDLEEGVKVLWKNGIYAESGMGCTGPVIRISEKNNDAAVAILKKEGYIG
jgi:hypothetical protein